MGRTRHWRKRICGRTKSKRRFGVSKRKSQRRSEFDKSACAIVDFGTGDGIPGIPIRLVRPEIALTLVESRRKCVSFLGELKRELSSLLLLRNAADLRIAIGDGRKQLAGRDGAPYRATNELIKTSVELS